MRYKVVFKNGSGYASFDERDYERALDLFKSEGIRMLRQKDIFDEGTLVFGLPEVVDLTKNFNAN